MTRAKDRAIFDCNIFLQAMLSDRGPSYRCVRLAREQEFELFVSPFILQELRRLPDHPELRRFRHLTPELVEQFIVDLLPRLNLTESVPEVFNYARDPKDAHYVNLAVATQSTDIVSRDHDLLDLMNPANSEGRDFRVRFPLIQIVDPATFLREIRRSR